MRMDPALYVKSHPKGFEVEAPLLHIHIYASAEDRQRAEALVEAAVGRLKQLLIAKFGGRAEISTTQAPR
jgi:molybdopterin-biosynthesis enzyme MoeA-like protein